MARENRTHHERKNDDALTQDERDKAHSSVRVDVLCVEDSHGCHVVIVVGRVIVQRHHASITYQN